MSNLLLMFIVFIEGFASLGYEVIALRRLMPHVGSSITVTVPTVGLFLAALAMGYWSGGRIQDRFLERVSRNFLVAAFIAVVPHLLSWTSAERRRLALLCHGRGPVTQDWPPVSCYSGHRRAPRPVLLASSTN